jgi:hypothetical protein
MKSRSMIVGGAMALLMGAGMAHAALVTVVSESYSSTNGGTGDNWGIVPNNGQWHYQSLISNSDLINSGSGSLSGVSFTGLYGGGGGDIAFLNNGQLTDNDAGYIGNDGGGQGFPGYVSVNDNSPIVVTYTLNTTINTLGYDLTRIDTFGAWWDNRCSQKYTVSVEYVNNPGFFTQLGGTFSIPNVGGQGQSTHLQLANDGGGAFATGVSAIRFSLDTVENWNAYREIDVVGTATIPEPGSGLMLMGALAGIGVLRRKLHGRA